jgi:hypothetical protein
LLVLSEVAQVSVGNEFQVCTELVKGNIKSVAINTGNDALSKVKHASSLVDRILIGKSLRDQVGTYLNEIIEHLWTRYTQLLDKG